MANEIERKRKARKQRRVTDGEQGFCERTAAAKLGISYITLFRKRKAGLIPFYRVGSRVLYDDNCLHEFKQKHLQHAA